LLLLKIISNQNVFIGLMQDLSEKKEKLKNSLMIGYHLKNVLKMEE
jgi:hypothetical protein